MGTRNKITKVIFAIFFTFITFVLFAQDADKAVTITASGSGKTLEDAKQAALRSATEQAFGAFISSKTEMFNDQVVADQMASVSSGNIKSFSILNESQLPDGSWGVTLKALVSVDKLTSFVEAKGIAIEIKGGMFALNIKQQLLNEQNETQVITNMIGVLHETMQKSFDYSIKAGNPISIQGGAINWEIPISITAKTNQNINFCIDYFTKVVYGVILNSNEIENYKNLNRQVFPVILSYKGDKKKYFLRNKYTIMAIESFASNWDFYVSNFKISNEIEQVESVGNGKLNNFIEYSTAYNKDGYKYQYDPTITFPDTGKVVCVFNWKDRKSLKQIEEISEYKVNSIGIKSFFKHGGIVVEEINGHGFVCALSDIDLDIVHINGIVGWGDRNGNALDREGTNKVCNDLILNGYNDWRIPDGTEFKKISINLYTKHIGNFSLIPRYIYNLPSNYPIVGHQMINLEDKGMDSGDRLHKIRPIRFF